ncbi:chemotaxis protein [Paraburkholderia lacunae]|uniref:Chemotaxis protein n=1 Tax=Paraburkholderia lacunae TaxID=2211104 RepID=A0A370MZI4_9BURK|nr:chemotaxis protein [Paraburkholderia lacunae]
MPSLKNLRVLTQLMLGFSAVIALLIGLGALSLFEVSAENNHVAQLRDNWLPSVRSSLQMQSGLRAIRLAEFRAASSLTPAQAQEAETRIEAGFADYRRPAAEYEKLITEPEEKAAYADIQRLMPQYLDLDQQLRALVKESKQADAIDLLRGQLGEIRGAMEKDIKTIVDVNVAGAAREGEAADRAYSHAVALVVGLIVIATVIALALALVIARGLARQLGGEPCDAAALASDIADGNLLTVVRLKAGDRGSLMFSLGAMKDQLTRIVRGIQTSSESISVAAGEIAQGNTDLSQRTEEQAASLEETASSMEELTSTVRHNANNARQATTLASAASGIARRGGEVVGRVVDTMQEISGSSAKMSEIINVIEGIAFQTNILALNAAVEAARAGEQGRGFAVVAGEVRTLAQRSATAAKEIKDLISESVNRVDAGSKLVEEAGTTISEIVESVKRVTDIVGEISSASEEQSAGIEQVNQAVSQMDQVTQQNAALVEEAAAATQSMSQQARELREAVAVFRIEDTGPSASRMVAPRNESRRPAPTVRTPPRATSTKTRTTPAMTADRDAAAATDTGAEHWQTF